MAVQIERRLFSVDEYERMVEAGILTEDDRVELIEGEIIQMSPIGSHHAACVKRLNVLLGRAVGDKAIVSVQDPIRLSDRSEPQPDLALLRPREDYYAQKHPAAADVYLVIEVAETSLAYDREVKLRQYAQAMIPEAWLVDVSARSVGQYAQPDGKTYLTIRQLKRGETLESPTIPGLSLSVDAIFG